MARKFIFIKDIENLLQSGKTTMELPEGSRFSPAAWDLVREKNIKISYATQPSQSVDGKEDRKSRQQSSSDSTAIVTPALAAVASEDREPSGAVGRLAGRSPYFLIFDFKGRFIDIIKNPYRAESEMVGRQVADLLAASEITAFVAEKFGQKMKDALTDKNIQFFEFSGSIQEAIKTVFEKKGGDKSVKNH